MPKILRFLDLLEIIESQENKYMVKNEFKYS